MDAPPNLLVLPDQDLGPALVRLIDTSHVLIRLIQYQFKVAWRPPPILRQILHALLSAADRGCTIRILLNHRTTRGPAGSDHGRLFAALDHPGIEIREYVTHQILHVKTILFDDKVAVLGSHNLSQRSLLSSRNLSICISHAPTLVRLVALADRLWEASPHGPHHLPKHPAGTRGRVQQAPGRAVHRPNHRPL